MTKRIQGEARVAYVSEKHAQLAMPGLNGKIFVVPSSVLGQRPHGYPPLTDMLSLNDIVKFIAESQPEKNGVRYMALDGSVKRMRAGRVISDVGTLTKLDDAHGQFGFIVTANGTNIFFNANVVRPETNDVMKVFKRNQTVRFEAIEQPEVQNTPWRAIMVCSRNYKEPKDSNKSTQQHQPKRPPSIEQHPMTTTPPQQRPFIDPFDSSHCKSIDTNFGHMVDFGVIGDGSGVTSLGDSPTECISPVIFNQQQQHNSIRAPSSASPPFSGPAKWFENLLPPATADITYSSTTFNNNDDDVAASIDESSSLSTNKALRTTSYSSMIEMLAELSHQLAHTNIINCEMGCQQQQHSHQQYNLTSSFQH